LLYGRGMKTILAIASACLLTSAAACKKDEPAKKQGGDEGGSGKVTDPGKPTNPKSKDTGPFAGWDLDARRAAFQGAHVTSGSNGLGSWEAWNVDGDKVTVWDGTTEKTLELFVQSPCEVKITERGSDGSSSSTTHHFTMKDGAVAVGLGNAGSRRGNEAVACVSNKVFTLDAQGTCLSWEQDMFDETKWKSEPGTCGFAKDGDKEVFKATANGSESELEIDGDTMWSQQLASSHSEKMADYAAAKAARDAK